MKKNNKKGFMLIETLLVSTFVLGVLTYLFVQFTALKRNYDDNFKYNTVTSLYGVKNINQYIAKYNSYPTLTTSINTFGYLEFSCATINGTTCNSLIESINAKNIYFIRDSIFKNNINPNLIIFSQNDELYRFIKKIKFSNEENKYHIIAEYNDNTYAAIEVTL